MHFDHRFARPVAAEGLEARRLLAASLSAGVLSISATTGNDAIVISIDPANSSRLKVSEGGVVTRFGMAGVQSISANLFKGNDSLTIGETIAIPAVVNGAGGRDTILGGAGRDSLDGGEGDDVLTGRGNKDRLTGGKGTDNIHGGPNKDTVSYEYVADSFTVGSERTGYGVVITLDGIINEQEAIGADQDGTISDTIDSSVEHVIGSQFKDSITGSGGDNVLSGGGGGDVITGNGGNDLIDGGKGADTLNGGSGNDTITGGDSADRVFGNSGTDQLTGGASGDTFTAGEESDGEVLDYLKGTDSVI